jgi:MarR family transcriptional regulator, organic hydroperoxide resistance regulator
MAMPWVPAMSTRVSRSAPRRSSAAAVSRLRLYRQLQLAAHSLHKAADRALLAAGGVTTAQAALLVVLQRQTARQRDLAQQLGINESAVTAMATRLQALGLIVRERADGDSRSWHLQLTVQGAQTLAAVEPAFHQINQRLAALFDRDEAQALADALQRVHLAFAGAAGPHDG